jgi:hypothetical protein
MERLFFVGSSFSPACSEVTTLNQFFVRGESEQLRNWRVAAL